MTAQRKTVTTQTPIQTLFETWKAEFDAHNKTELYGKNDDAEGARICDYIRQALQETPQTPEDVWRLAVMTLNGIVDIDVTFEGRFMKRAADTIGLPETYQY